MHSLRGGPLFRHARAEAKAADLRPVIAEIRAAGVATLDGMAKALTARGVPSLAQLKQCANATP